MSGARASIRFEPGLEGLRGISVIGVLLFHAGLGFARGGYLGVSTFFTLSGYLITSLLLVEREAAGRIDLRAFWGRRLRRLMPAVLIALAAIGALSAAFADAQQLAGLRADILWSLGYAANWHFLRAEVAYAQIFSAPSVVQHFWSLAIEEQFYLGFPLLALATLAVSRRAFAASCALGVVASLGTAVALSASDAPVDRIYYGTDTRAAEFLIGALLAFARIDRWRWSERGGGFALFALLVMWSRVPLDSDWLYRGGFGLHALVSALVISAAVRPAGPVRRLLSIAPLRWVGKISYGVYLYHWPVYLWMPATGLTGVPLLAADWLVTLALSTASYRYVEEPIRRARMLEGRRSGAAALVAALGVAAIAWAVTRSLPDGSLEFSQSEPSASAARPGQLRIALFGDSTALRLGKGLRRWIDETDRVAGSPGLFQLGCGMDSGGWRRHRGRERRLGAECGQRDARWRASLEKSPADVAVVLSGRWEVSDRRLPDDPTWRALGDPVFDAYLRAELLRAVDTLAATGARVVWLTSPTFENPQPASDDMAFDPRRVARFNELIRELAELRPGVVTVLEFGDFVAKLPETIGEAAPRPDGVHLSNAAAFEISRSWLGPKILESFDAR